MSKIIYISGPMTGHEDYNRQAFYKAEARLKSAGFVVLNPAVNPEGLSYAQYMLIDVAMLNVCDCIYMLIGHEDSPGAKAELALAKSMKFKEYYEQEGDYLEAADDLLVNVLVTNGTDVQTGMIQLSETCSI